LVPLRSRYLARKVMESYQNWLGEGPELSVLRVLGLFDRPADEKALEALLKPPAIPGLTEPLVDLNPTEWRAVLNRLRRARLLAAEDPHNPGYLDTHPLVREYFGELSRANEQKLGRNAVGGSTSTIERLRPSSLKVSRRWSRFSCQSCAPATSVCSTTHYTKCICRVSSGAINSLPQTFWG
jgi:hypothetical protein